MTDPVDVVPGGAVVPVGAMPITVVPEDAMPLTDVPVDAMPVNEENIVLPVFLELTSHPLRLPSR